MQIIFTECEYFHEMRIISTKYGYIHKKRIIPTECGYFHNNIHDQNEIASSNSQLNSAHLLVAVLCPSLYLYHDEVRRYYLMEEFTEIFVSYSYGRIVQVLNVQKIWFNIGSNMIQQKHFEMGLIFMIYVLNLLLSHLWKIFLKSVERANMSDYVFNEGNKNWRIRNNNIINRYPNHNQEIIWERQVIQLELN